jgi:peptide/nickel transport system substrate-binding protein
MDAVSRRVGVDRVLTRRRALAGGAIAGGALLAACRGAQAPASSQTRSSGTVTPKAGGTVAVSHNFDRGIDPHVNQAQDSGAMGLFYQTLIRFTAPSFGLEPEIATRWEVPSQTELVFTLAPNVVWHDKPPVNGRPLTANDVIFSYQRAGGSDPRYVNRSFLTSIDKMEAVDPHTLRLTLKQADVTQLANLAIFSLAILAPEAVDAAKNTLNTAEFTIGTGPFVLQTSEPNVGSSFARNPKYFKSGLPYLDKVMMHAFRDYESEWAAFLAGQLDHRFVPGESADSFATTKKDQYGLSWFGDLAYGQTQAHTQKKPFDDPRVTRALRLLLDHDEFKTGWANNWWGRGRFSVCFAAATADPWDISEDEYRQHLEWKQPKDDAIRESLTLLNAAGFTKDKPLKFTLSCGGGNAPETTSGQLTQAQFKRNSHGAVDPDLRVVDNSAWNQVRANGDFEYYAGGHSSGGTDPDTYFSGTFKTGGSRNYGKMSDPKLDDMFAKQKTLFDDQERKKAVRDIVLYMIDNLPYGSHVARYVLNASQPRVHDFPPGSQSFEWGDHYESVWIG